MVNENKKFTKIKFTKGLKPSKKINLFQRTFFTEKNGVLTSTHELRRGKKGKIIRREIKVLVDKDRKLTRKLR